MNQRRKQPGLTRQRILSAVGREFARLGYAGCGIAGIVEAADLTKGALFHHFSDKRALAVAWVDEVLADGIRNQWLEPLATVDSLSGLKRLCRERLETAGGEDPTFLLAGLSAELARQGGELAQRVDSLYGAWRTAIAEALERGRRYGWIYPSVKPFGEAALLVALVTGAQLQAGTNPDPEVRLACLTAMEDYLETLRKA